MTNLDMKQVFREAIQLREQFRVIERYGFHVDGRGRLFDTGPLKITDENIIATCLACNKEVGRFPLDVSFEFPYYHPRAVVYCNVALRRTYAVTKCQYCGLIFKFALKTEEVRTKNE